MRSETELFSLLREFGGFIMRTIRLFDKDVGEIVIFKRKNPEN